MEKNKVLEKKGRDYISYSQLNAYETCPKKYYYKYIEGFQTVTTKEMLEGKKTHQAIAESLLNNNLEAVPEKSRYIIEKYFLPNDFKVEQEINHELFLYKIKAIIDIYATNGNTCYILDWKRNILPESDNQLKLYALVLKELHPEIKNFICWFFCTESGFYKRYFYTEEDLEEFENELYSLIEKIENDNNFEENIGSHCGYCSFADKCLAKRKISADKLAALTITNEEEFIELGKAIYLYEAVIKKVKDKMKDYLLLNGLNEVKISESDRFYIAFSAVMKSGKVKVKKSQKAA